MFQHSLVGHDLHGTASQHEAGTDQNGIADLPRCPDAVGDVGHRHPFGVRDVQLLQDLLESIPVLRPEDGGGIRSQDLHAPPFQRLRQVHGGLSPQRGDDSQRLFQIHDIEDVLHRERFKVQFVRGGVVGGHRLRVVVDDDGFVAHVPYGLHRMYRGVVELHALSDTDGAGAQHQDLLLRGDHRFVLLLIGGIEIGHVAVKLAGTGIDHLVHRSQPIFLPQPEDLLLRTAGQFRDVGIGKAHALGPEQQVSREGTGNISALFLHRRLQSLFKLHDVPDLVQKEQVDAGAGADHLGIGSQPQKLRDGVDSVIGAVFDVGKKLLHGFLPVFRFRFVRETGHVEFGKMDVVLPVLQGPDGLQKALLHGSADAHGLPRCLHLGPEDIGCQREFVKGKARHLRHHIVQCRFKAGRSVGQRDLIQIHAHGDLRGDPGNGIPAGFGSQRRGPGYSRIDFDDIVPEGFRIQGKLHVASAPYLQCPDNAQSTVPEHVVFPVGEGLGWRHHHGVSRVDPHRVQVFHIADGDGGIVSVPHHFVFDLLIALDALFHQDLMHGRLAEGMFHPLLHLLIVVGKSAAGASQSEGRTQDHGITDLLRRLEPFLHGGGDAGGYHRFPQFLTQFLEQFPVLCPPDAGGVGAQHLDLALLQHALFLQLHGQVQSRLSSQPGDDGIRAFIAADPCQILQGQGLHIHFVRDGVIGHDGGGVGVCQDHFVSFLLQRQARLGAGVIEFRRLSDDDGAGADDQYFMDIISFRHGSFPLSQIHILRKPCKEIPAVLRSGTALRMILDGEDEIVPVFHPLHGIIQHVHMGHGKTGALQRLLFHRVAVVLAGDLYLSGGEILYRMVSSPVAELQFVGLPAVGQRQELMPQTDAEHGDLPPQYLQRFDHFRYVFRISGSVGDEHTIGLQRQDLLRRGIKRHDGNVAFMLVEHPYDIPLHAAVDGRHVIPGIGGAAVPAFFAAAAPDGIMGHRRSPDNVQPYFQRCIGVRKKTPAGTQIPDAAYQLSRIHSRDPRHAGILQQLLQGLHGTEVGRIPVEIPDDKRIGSDDAAFKILLRDAVVTHERIGHNDGLVGIGRIGQDLLISCHGRIEYDLAHRIPFCAESLSQIFAAVFQNKLSQHSHSLSFSLSKTAKKGTSGVMPEAPLLPVISVLL